MISDGGKFSTYLNGNIELEIYSDEIFSSVDPFDNTKWMYLGALFVPKDCKEDVLTNLKDLRCIKNHHWNVSDSCCPDRCKFHEDNDTEIHFKEIHRSSARYMIAKNWINFINREACQKHRKMLYFNILGINLSNIDYREFGSGGKIELNIYNRFYRTVLMSGLNYFFKDYSNIVVNSIFHDRGSQEYHDFFPWHPIQQTEFAIDKLSINCDEIKFIDSDHRESKSDESQFIQLIDLILGATFSTIHNSSNNSRKKEVCELFKPTLRKLLDRKKSQKGQMIGNYYKSNYYRTYQISFFPKDKMTPEEVITYLDLQGNVRTKEKIKVDNFYYSRLIEAKNQQKLDKWF
ncbi:hypothetical protein FTO70_15435 [Methanosarcina sp. KYL-1]|uniref:hypothetical protein n=1 Tax=Methanosarcina sp. KYL-1 TaxID=2602068 RepID=UPI00210089AB|nr:hypothetical protein [Methanosarcina sp. KYL-1]MCQ1537037.1 hypothetical protein [Methanosarcina sp. KYL-1]